MRMNRSRFHSKWIGSLLLGFAVLGSCATRKSAVEQNTCAIRKNTRTIETNTSRIEANSKAIHESNILFEYFKENALPKLEPIAEQVETAVDKHATAIESLASALDNAAGALQDPDGKEQGGKGLTSAINKHASAIESLARAVDNAVGVAKNLDVNAKIGEMTSLIREHKEAINSLGHAIGGPSGTPANAEVREQDSVAKPSHTEGNQSAQSLTGTISNAVSNLKEARDSGLVLGFAVTLFLMLQFLAQWSWSVLTSLEKEKRPHRGDPEIVIRSYLAGSLVLCCVGTVFFLARFMRGEGNDLLTHWALALFALPAAFILLLATVCHLLILWLMFIRQSWRPELSQRSWIDVLWVIFLVSLGVPGVIVAFDAINGSGVAMEQTVRILLVLAFGIIAFGTQMVVRRDDLVLVRAFKGPGAAAGAADDETPLMPALRPKGVAEPVHDGLDSNDDATTEKAKNAISRFQVEVQQNSWTFAAFLVANTLLLGALIGKIKDAQNHISVSQVIFVLIAVLGIIITILWFLTYVSSTVMHDRTFKRVERLDRSRIRPFALRRRYLLGAMIVFFFVAYLLLFVFGLVVAVPEKDEDGVSSQATAAFDRLRTAQDQFGGSPGR